MQPFHLAFPVADIEKTRNFFVDVLGCELGRESSRWIDFNFFGHQISAHLAPEMCAGVATNPVDGEQVPVRHFGIVLEWENWQGLADRIQARQQTFLIKPQIRFAGEVGEQGTFFILDPSGNALEFKSFKDSSQLFAH